MSDPQSCRWWVVTDLDGTLMDHHYDWSPAAAVLRSLQRAGVPVIPCTSKTAEEVERFRAALSCGTHTSSKMVESTVKR